MFVPRYLSPYLLANEIVGTNGTCLGGTVGAGRHVQLQILLFVQCCLLASFLSSMHACLLRALSYSTFDRACSVRGREKTLENFC